MRRGAWVAMLHCKVETLRKEREVFKAAHLAQLNPRCGGVDEVLNMQPKKLLVAPGITSRSSRNKKLLVTKDIATRSKKLILRRTDS